MNLGLRNALYFGGNILAIAGLVFVIIRLFDYGSDLDFTRYDLVDWLIVASMALIYGLSNIMLAFAWWHLIRQLGGNVSCSWAIRMYGVSQIAKYLPGNIFHLAGRHAMGMAAGIPGYILLKSSIFELGLIAATGSLFSFLALPFVMKDFSHWAGPGAFTTSISIFAVILFRQFGQFVTKALAWYVCFLTTSALLFAGLFVLLLDSLSFNIGFLIPLGGSYLLAWLIGLTTPGSPAGLGVREVVLMYMLNGMVNEPDLLLVILISRMVTVTGDAFFFVMASFLQQEYKTPQH